MGNLRSEMIRALVTVREREMVEAHAKRRKMSVAEYARLALLFDMMMDGNYDAFKHVGAEVVGKMRVRLGRKFDAVASDERHADFEHYVGQGKR